VLTNVPVNAKAAPLELIMQRSGLIHGAISYPVGTRSVLDLWRLARTLRALRSGVLVYLSAPRGRVRALRDWVFFKLCGFKRIIGLPVSYDRQYCRNVAVKAGEYEEERECQRLARCLEELGPIDLSDPTAWTLRLAPDEVKVGLTAVSALDDRPYLVVNFGGKAIEKDWGLENWRALLRRLDAHYPGTGLLIVGGAEDFARGSVVQQDWGGAVVNACGRLTPRESAAALARAVLFVGHDSGPLHLAAAAGVPCVGLFGQFNKPKRWHPLGSHHRIIHRSAGIRQISVEEVYEAATAILRSNNSLKSPQTESSPYARLA